MKAKSALIILGLLVVLLIILRPYYLLLSQTFKISPLKTLLSWDSIRKVNNQTNILILGIAGGNHDGPTLSDSILVANYDFGRNRLVTLGIPRDIWSSTLQDKINSAYAYGEAKEKGGGLKLAKAEASAIIGQPIQYAAVINFQGFKELIDYLGGIDVNVERSFTDKKYPIEGKENDNCGGNDPEFSCRYETIRFDKGMTHMNGINALIFVRSRNAIGVEGSDFARTQREQKVLIAVKTKITAILKSFNIAKIQDLYRYINPIIQRDITNQQAAIIFKQIVFGGNFQQASYALPREFFSTPDVRVYGSYILIPVNNDSNRIYNYVNCLFNGQKNSCN